MSKTFSNIDELLQETQSRVRAQRLFEVIRERISLLRYLPGSALRERDLAEEFGVSRTPIRTVLQRLEFGGLTYSRQGHGTIVTNVDLDSLANIYLIRLKLSELYGVSATTENAASVIEQFRALSRTCAKIKSRPSLETFGKINIGLHAALQSLLSNYTLKAHLDILFYQTVRVWFYILSADDLNDEISELAREIHELQHFLQRGDLESMGYVRRNYVSLVYKRLSEVGVNPLQQSRIPL